MKISDFFKQVDNTLYCNQPCNMIIDMSYYKTGDSFIKNPDYIWLKSLVSVVKVNDLDFDFILDYEVTIPLIDAKYQNNDEYVEISFNINAAVIDVSSTTGDIGKQISYLERLLGGREVVKDPKHLFKKLLTIYSPPVATFDSVHLEVLLSQVLRNKKNIQKLARLVEPYDPILINIKKIVFSSGFLQGLAFENIGEAVRTGLIQEDNNDKSIIERLITGTLVEPENK